MGHVTYSFEIAPLGEHPGTNLCPCSARQSVDRTRQCGCLDDSIWADTQQGVFQETPVPTFKRPDKQQLQRFKSAFRDLRKSFTPKSSQKKKKKKQTNGF